MKKLISLLCLLVLLCMSACASAANYPDPLFENGYYYDVENGGATITSYTGDDSTLVIPDTLGGYPVKKIGYNAFDGHDYLTSVKLPVHLEHIGWYAFANCYELEEVVMPQGLKSIGKYAFSTCQSLEEIDLPDTLEQIYGYAFSDCYALKSITIPANVERITNFTFADCYDLESITINGKDTIIYNWAFSDFHGNGLPVLGVDADRCTFTCWRGVSGTNQKMSPDKFAQKHNFRSIVYFNDTHTDNNELPPAEILPLDQMINGQPAFVRVTPTAATSRVVSFEIDLIDAYENTLDTDGRIRIPLVLSYEVLGMTRAQASRMNLTVEHVLASGRSEFFSVRRGNARLTNRGLEFTVTSLSPFHVTWNEGTDDLPQTGDSSLPLAMLFASLILCTAASRMLMRKKA